jgi:hypothetical protein
MNLAQPQHDDDVQIIDVPVPARAFLRCLLGSDQLGDYATTRGISYAKIALLEKRAQPFTDPRSVAGLDVRKRIDDGIIEQVRGSPSKGAAAWSLDAKRGQL